MKDCRLLLLLSNQVFIDTFLSKYCVDKKKADRCCRNSFGSILHLVWVSVGEVCC